MQLVVEERGQKSVAEGDYRGHNRTECCLRKESVKPPGICNLWRGRLEAALFNGAKCFSCGQQTAQVTVRERYSTTLKEWFRAAIAISQGDGRGLC